MKEKKKYRTQTLPIFNSEQRLYVFTLTQTVIQPALDGWKFIIHCPNNMSYKEAIAVGF